MPGVYFCSETNSTKFTTCCRTAICDDERRCPVCRAEIAGDARSRHNEAMLSFYGPVRLAKIRRESAEKNRREERGR